MNQILESITVGIEKKPPRICLYGEHGIGKSTFANQFENPIFVQTEEGLNQIDCAKFPLAKTFDDVVSFLRVLYCQEHNYKTVIIDSCDWLEKLTFEHVAKKNNVDSVADINFGRGFDQSLDLMCEILTALDYLRKKNMTVILIAHSDVRKFESPTSPSYDRYTLSMRSKVNAKIMQWADLVGFINFDVKINREVGGFGKEIKKAISGQRYLYCAPAAAYEAKNRYSIPEKIELNFETLKKYIY
jgi:hypothetical protein